MTWILKNTRGQNNPRAKITNDQATHISKCLKSGVPIDELAALFGIATKTIRNIKKKHRWKFIHDKSRTRKQTA